MPWDRTGLDLMSRFKPYECTECEETYSNLVTPCLVWKGIIVCDNCWDELDTEENIAMRDWHLVGDCDAENWRPGE